MHNFLNIFASQSHPLTAKNNKQRKINYSDVAYSRVRHRSVRNVTLKQSEENKFYNKLHRIKVIYT